MDWYSRYSRNQKENSINFYDDLHKKNMNSSKLVLTEYNCNEPWGQVGIHADGTVGPCCNTVGRNYLWCAATTTSQGNLAK